MTNENNTYQLFTPSGCLTLDALRKYQSKSLSVEELKLAEDHIGDCELCLDAIEGIDLLSDSDQLESIVSEINDNLRKGLDSTTVSKNNKPYFISNKIVYFSAAASVIILVGLFSYLQFFTNKPEQSDLALQTYIVDEIPIPTDENDMIIEENLEKSEDINKKPIAAAPKKQEKEIASEKESKSIRENYYQPDLEKVRTADSGTEAFLTNQAIPKSTPKEPMMNESVDIASTQPLDYYIARITILDKAYEEMRDEDQSKVNMIVGLSMNSGNKNKEGNTILEQTKQCNKQTSEQTISKPKKEVKSVDQLSNENHFFNAVGEKPEFPGGEAGMMNYLHLNMKYPEEAKKYNIQGSVLVSFIVEENGEVSSVEVIRGIGSGCDEEAKRVFAEMPPWKPAIKDGKGERVLFKMPISFRLY